MVDQDEKQRVFQASLEYWKAMYEYFKTFATICLASIAAFSALLAGFFAEPPKDVTDSMFSLIPLSQETLSWFGDHRSIWMTLPFFAFIAVGIVSLAGTHYCRKALWDSTVTNKSDFEDQWRYKWLIMLRALVWFSYGSATIDFFIIAPLSIPL
jgi:hypothetical protein